MAWQRWLALALAMCCCFWVAVPAVRAEDSSGPIMRACLPYLPTGGMGYRLRTFLSRMDRLLDAEETYQADLSDEDGLKALTVSMVTAGQPFTLFVVRYSVERGEVQFPDSQVMEALADAQFVSLAARSKGMGLPVELQWYGQRVTAGNMRSMMVALYEHWAEREIQTMGLKYVEGFSETDRKALAIGLLETGESANPQTVLSAAEQAELYWRFAQGVADQIGHQAAGTMTGKQAAEALQIVLEQLGIAGAVRSPGIQVMTREDYAQMAVPVYLRFVLKREKFPNDAWLPTFDDTDELIFQQAAALSLLSPVYPPDSDLCLFDAERIMTRQEIYQALLHFARAATDETEEQDLVWNAVLPQLAVLWDALAELCADAPQRVTVDNGRDYAWYLQQEDTGPYSIDNCMPTATAMALHWADRTLEYRVEDIRAMDLMEGRAWTPEQVEQVFDTHRMDYRILPIDMDSMLEALDQGHILLVLLNEGSIGHCLIVKGYQREGEGVWMICYDPSSPSVDAFGKNVGEDRRMEAGELIRAMENHWWMYFDIAGRALD